jgi:tRNA dimethylallyltransferase
MLKMRWSDKPLLVLLGPTAVGKTSLAIELAEALHGEIIGADSRQVYRQMDIGTAKPTLSQCQQIPHHLINLINPDQNLSLAEYQAQAYAAIEGILERNHLPMLVGGTGQYITAVTEGWSIPAVPPNETLREELEGFAHEYGAAALYQRLEDVDPSAAKVIDYRNVRRVIRALEVYMTTGIPISVLQQKRPTPYRTYQLGLTLDRDTLYAQADQRVDQMIQDGFVDEVQALLEKGYDPQLPSMSGLGYRQIAAHLKKEISLAEAITDTKHATHDFIRRQFTWFKGHDNGILWHNSRDIDISKLIKSIAHWLQQD